MRVIKQVTLLIIVSFQTLSSVAQEFEVIETDDDLSYYFLYLNKDSLKPNENMAKLPTIGLGPGIINFSGEVKDSYSNATTGRNSLRLTISRNVNSFLTVDYSVLYGKLTGNQRTEFGNYNFQTDLLCGGVGLNYNFKHLLDKADSKFAMDPAKRKVWPYVSLGLEAFEFSSKGDLTDEEGNYYYYWSDGSIRNIDENSGRTGESVVMQRDYIYETDLRELNKDGLGKYSQVAFALSLEVGVKIKISEQISLRTGMTYHISFNDKIDNITSKGVGDRAGTRGKDNFLFTFVSLHYDLFDRHDIEYNGGIIDGRPELFIFGDYDEDNVPDLNDECIGTPRGVLVDIKGCPLDSDRDGIGQYIDEELETAKGNIVDLKGVTMPEDIPGDSLAIPHDKICEYYPSLCSKRMYDVIIEDERFIDVDSDQDGYISYEELVESINKWLDGGSKLSYEDLMDLNEYFFGQATMDVFY